MSDLMSISPEEGLRRKFRCSASLIAKESVHGREDKPIRVAERGSLVLGTAANIAARKAGLPPARLKRVLTFIDENLDMNITLAELARNAKMSVYYFATLFKGSTGLSPHRYILHQRVFRARELLRDTRLSVMDVSLDIGFGRQNNFARAFRRITGMTPTHFRHSKRLEERIEGMK